MALERPAGSYRARLIAFYSKYNATKLPTVDDALSRFAGREEEMFRALVNKYGPEPAPTGAAASAGMTYEARLRAFFAAYRPEKVPGVTEMLAKYAGREADLMTSLVAKYGPEPAPQPATATEMEAPARAGPEPGAGGRASPRPPAVPPAPTKVEGPRAANLQAVPAALRGLVEREVRDQLAAGQATVDDIDALMASPLMQSILRGVSASAQRGGLLGIDARSTLGAPAAAVPPERRMERLAAAETEARAALEAVEADERAVQATTALMQSAALRRIDNAQALAVQHDRNLRHRCMRMWMELGRASLTRRQAEVEAGLTPYQRMALQPSAVRQLARAATPGRTEGRSVARTTRPSSTGASVRSGVAPTPRQDIRRATSRPSGSRAPPPPVPRQPWLAPLSEARRAVRLEEEMRARALEERLGGLRNEQLDMIARKVRQLGLPVPTPLASVIDRRCASDDAASPSQNYAALSPASAAAHSAFSPHPNVPHRAMASVKAWASPTGRQPSPGYSASRGASMLDLDACVRNVLAEELRMSGMH
jgi:hypothetical protein